MERRRAVDDRRNPLRRGACRSRRCPDVCGRTESRRPRPKQGSAPTRLTGSVARVTGRLLRSEEVHLTVGLGSAFSGLALHFVSGGSRLLLLELLRGLLACL